MIYIRVTLLFAAALLLQWVWSSYGAIGGMVPQLALILTVVASAREGPVAGMSLGFGWGLFLDVFEVHLFGAKALALTLIGFGVGSARRQVDVSGPASLAVVMLGMTWGFFLIEGVLGLIFMKDFLWVGWKIFLLAPLYNCLLILPAQAAWEGARGRP